MRLVEKKCPNCGGALKFNFEDKETTCEFCGRSFEIERDQSISNDNDEIFNADNYALTEEQKKVLGAFAGFTFVPIAIFAIAVIAMVTIGIVSSRRSFNKQSEEVEVEEKVTPQEEEKQKTPEEILKEQGYVLSFEDLKDNHLKDIHDNTLSILNKYVKGHSTWFYSHGSFSYVGMYLLTTTSGNTLYDVYKMNFKIKGKTVPYFTAVKYNDAKVKDGKLIMDMDGDMLPFSMTMESSGNATLGYESAKDFYNKVIRGSLESAKLQSVGGVYKE